MKVAKKSPPSRRTAGSSRVTVTLPLETYQLLDRLRGDAPRSAFIDTLVERERLRLDEEEWLAKGRAQYTPEVCRRTLEIHAAFPIHEA